MLQQQNMCRLIKQNNCSKATHKEIVHLSLDNGNLISETMKQSLPVHPKMYDADTYYKFLNQQPAASRKRTVHSNTF